MKQHPPGQRMAVIRGRHRTEAARMAGVSHLRCNVHADGRLGLYEISVDDLVTDEGSQFDWAYSESKAKKIAANWNPRAVGVLDVTPVTGGLSKKERNQLKLAMDRDQRGVSGLEIFLNEVGAGYPDPTEIKKIVEEHGFEVAKNRKSTTIHNRIEAVATLRSIYKKGGADLLTRTLAMARLWYDEPQSVTNYWLGGLGLFCDLGLDDLNAAQVSRLEKLIPAKELKKALGKAENVITGSAGSGLASPLAMILAEQLRVAARKRKPKVTVEEVVEAS